MGTACLELVISSTPESHTLLGEQMQNKEQLVMAEQVEGAMLPLFVDNSSLGVVGKE